MHQCLSEAHRVGHRASDARRVDTIFHQFHQDTICANQHHKSEVRVTIDANYHFDTGGCHCLYEHTVNGFIAIAVCVTWVLPSCVHDRLIGAAHARLVRESKAQHASIAFVQDLYGLHFT